MGLSGITVGEGRITAKLEGIAVGLENDVPEREGITAGLDRYRSKMKRYRDELKEHYSAGSNQGKEGIETRRTRIREGVRYHEDKYRVTRIGT